MDNIIIRPMKASDYEKTVELWEATTGIGLSEADNRERIRSYLSRNPEMSHVAEADGKLIGAVLCGHDGRRGYLHHLAVAISWRSRGIGRRLVDGCVACLDREGIDRCHLFVYPDNAEGMAFWRRMGFEQRRDIQLCSRNL